MARIVIIGASIGGLSAAYECRDVLGTEHDVTVISNVDYFNFVPSNPWVAVGWRKREDICLELAPLLRKKDIRFILSPAEAIEPDKNRVITGEGPVDYDYLIIATGPAIDFSAVSGLGPDNYTESVCTIDHAEKAWQSYQEFLKDPGPVVIGAAQGASCFGPAYETAFIIDADLRRRRLRRKVHMTFITSEPYLGHFGLAGVGASKRLMEDGFAERTIRPVTNAVIKEVADGRVILKDGGEFPFKYAMIIPAFKGVEAVAATPGLCNPKGFVLVDEYQCHPEYRNIYAVGVCVAMAPVEKTPVPTGAPKTGFMIESMVAAAVRNIKADIQKSSERVKPSLDTICLLDMGDTGAAFVAAPQMPPRDMTWCKKGWWVHLAKVSFEKYFLNKMKFGRREPVFERMILNAIGIGRLENN